MQPFIGSEIPETQAPSLHLCLVPNSYLLTRCTAWISFSKWSFLINKYIPKSKGYARHVTSQAELTNRISLAEKLLWGKFPPADGHPARLGNMKKDCFQPRGLRNGHSSAAVCHGPGLLAPGADKSLLTPKMLFRALAAKCHGYDYLSL